MRYVDLYPGVDLVLGARNGFSSRSRLTSDKTERVEIQDRRRRG